jgi:hypothetical protein
MAAMANRQLAIFVLYPARNLLQDTKVLWTDDGQKSVNGTPKTPTYQVCCKYYPQTG